MVDDTRTSATDRDENVGLQGLKDSVENAAKELGFAPRDVHRGIFGLSMMS